MRSLKIKCCLVIIALILFSAKLAMADPSPGIKWLQNEPLTLFDWGMYKSSKTLEQTKKRLAVLQGSTSFPSKKDVQWTWTEYDFPKNTIILGYGIILDNIEKATESACKEFLEKIRKFIFAVESFNPNDPADAVKTIKLYNRWFSHEGFKNSKRPYGIGGELAISSKLKLDMYSGNKSEEEVFTRFLSCSTNLSGPPVSVTKYKGAK